MLNCIKSQGKSLGFLSSVKCYLPSNQYSLADIMLLVISNWELAVHSPPMFNFNPIEFSKRSGVK